MVVYTLEQRWKILQQIDLQKMPILAKKSYFQMKLVTFHLKANCIPQCCRVKTKTKISKTVFKIKTKKKILNQLKCSKKQPPTIGWLYKYDERFHIRF